MNDGAGAACCGRSKAPSRGGAIWPAEASTWVGEDDGGRPARIRDDDFLSAKLVAKRARRGQLQGIRGCRVLLLAAGASSMLCTTDVIAEDLHSRCDISCRRKGGMKSTSQICRAMVTTGVAGLADLPGLPDLPGLW